VQHRMYTEQEATRILLAEGHSARDVSDEMAVLFRAGLQLDQPPDAWLLTQGELELLRLRLREQGV
jgi:hypothetical protein